ncbi:hypothetical protein BT69DRAFT_1302448 [Atractiella rhizophila]|nr:hypothetical protein BT69DRAFT_1302448 [Atractiella rhizophila]
MGLADIMVSVATDPTYLATGMTPGAVLVLSHHNQPINSYLTVIQHLWMLHLLHMVLLIKGKASLYLRQSREDSQTVGLDELTLEWVTMVQASASGPPARVPVPKPRTESRPWLINVAAYGYLSFLEALLAKLNIGDQFATLTEENWPKTCTTEEDFGIFQRDVFLNPKKCVVILHRADLEALEQPTPTPTPIAGVAAGDMIRGGRDPLATEMLPGGALTFLTEHGNWCFVDGDGRHHPLSENDVRLFSIHKIDMLKEAGQRQEEEQDQVALHLKVLPTL